MPRIGNDDGMEQFTTGAKFGFTGIGIEHLGATEYTLATIMVDVTSSVEGFEQDLHKALVAAVTACKKSPRSDNLLVRVCIFSTSVGVHELHGFKPLSQIDPAKDYPPLVPRGATPLCDAAFSAVGAMVDYGAKLMEGGFLVNGIGFLITDGAENSSTATPGMVKSKIAEVKKGEKLESLITVLIGINTNEYAATLSSFQAAAGIDKYLDVGDATPRNLAKLAEFVSQSVSSQSQSIGSGGPSQAVIDATI